jgi:chromate reductase, NAD(P)H dehydrogenase (quinone)
MSEICVISGTNRALSKTFHVAQNYQQLLKEKSIESTIFSLEDLPHNFAFAELYGKRSPEFQSVIDNFITPYTKFIFVVPEYNGSFPGVFKTFLDAVHPKNWTDKKVALVGVSDGRAGNLRGMDHLTNILNHLKITVYYQKTPFSQVSKLLGEDGKFASKETSDIALRQIEGFLSF